MGSHKSENILQDNETTNPDIFQLGYEPALDGLRGIAIFVVVVFNSHFIWMQGGFVGVDIFFVLSGFLITSLLIQEQPRSSCRRLSSFYLRRALRLLPALIVLILTLLAYAVIVNPDKAVITWRHLVYTLFYLANWAQVPPNSPGLGLLSHAWSLSVEEQFYIVWPPLLLMLLKLKSKNLILSILSFFAGISILLNVWYWQAKAPYLRMYFGSDTRANEILIGCIAALLLSWGFFRPSDRLKWIFNSGAILSVVGIFLSLFLVRHYGAFVYNGGFAIISMGTAALILDFLLFPSKLSRAFEFRPLVWLGKISYGLYLWHFPILEASQKIFDGKLHPAIYGSLGVIAALMAATASYYLIEQPFLKLKNRYANREPSSLPDVASVAVRV